MNKLFTSSIIVLCLMLWAISEPNDRFEYNRNGADQAKWSEDDDLNRD